MLWSFDCNHKSTFSACPWLLDHPSPSSQVSHHFKPPEHPIIGLRVVVQRISLRLASLGHCKHGPESDDSFGLSGGQLRWQAWQNRGKKGEPLRKWKLLTKFRWRHWSNKTWEGTAGEGTNAISQEQCPILTSNIFAVASELMTIMQPRQATAWTKKLHFHSLLSSCTQRTSH